VPEIEAIDTSTLLKLESEGWNVIPTARAAKLTMNREGIRRLAAEELGLGTSRYVFAATEQEFRAAILEIGTPCVVKPIMSSSGKGQSTIKSGTEAEIAYSWAYAQEGGRAGAGKVIVEGFVDFDFEITLLTVRHKGGTSFCDPIGHRQIDGDYRESWQPQAMSPRALAEAQRISAAVTGALGGWGLFGVELFVKGDQVLFSEVSPRPHDTGLVTLVSQELSEFALHARAILGLPIPRILSYGPAASCAMVVKGNSDWIRFEGIDKALEEPGVQVRLFGKPGVEGKRRMGVALATGHNTAGARAKARAAMRSITVTGSGEVSMLEYDM